MFYRPYVAITLLECVQWWSVLQSRLSACKTDDFAQQAWGVLEWGLVSGRSAPSGGDGNTAVLGGGAEESRQDGMQMMCSPYGVR